MAERNGEWGEGDRTKKRQEKYETERREKSLKPKKEVEYIHKLNVYII